MPYARYLRPAAIALAAAAGLAGPASAQLSNTCGVSALPMQFGVYSAFSGTASTTATTVTVTCTGVVGVLISYQIKLDGGGSGVITSRKLSEDLGSDELSYQIYTNSGRTIVWGDGVQGSVLSGSILLQVIASVSTHPVYGRIPASQIVNAGDYSDDLIMTVVY